MLKSDAKGQLIPSHGRLRQAGDRQAVPETQSALPGAGALSPAAPALCAHSGIPWTPAQVAEEQRRFVPAEGPSVLEPRATRPSRKEGLAPKSSVAPFPCCTGIGTELFQD